MAGFHLDDRTRTTLLWTRRARELAPFPPAVQEAMSALNGDRASARDVARLIGRDEAMSAGILRLVNSAFYGVRGRVTTVSHAVTLLGFQQTRVLIVAAAMLRQSRGGDALVDRNRQRIWLHSSNCARWARELAAATRYQAIEEASVAALLHDIGKIVMATTSPREFAASVEMSRTRGMESHEAEESTLGINHLEVGKMVCDHWRFPPPVRLAVASHHDSWPPHIDFGEPETSKLRHLLAVVRVANQADKESVADHDPAADGSELRVAIPPDDLLEAAGEVEALLRQ